MKIKLYLDFDGVILDTIDVTYKMFEENKKYKDMKEFYKTLDWNYILDVCKPINDSINYIQELVDSDLYDVNILTHVITREEAIAKKKFVDNNLPLVKLITVDKEFNKCDVVECENAVLVDDYMENVELWNSKGGIGIKFSDKGKEYEVMSISNLGMLIDKYKDIKGMLSNKNAC